MALGLLSFIPCFGGLVALVGWLWSLACGFFAVREVHQLDDGKTFRRVSQAGIPTLRVIPSPRLGKFGRVESIGWILPIGGD